MKRFIIIVLVLVVVGVGFYWGYRNANSPNQRSVLSNQKNEVTKSLPLQPNEVTKSPPLHSIGEYYYIIPKDAITRETTVTINLDTPTTIFDNDGFDRKMVIVVNSIPTKSNAVNIKQFSVEVQLTGIPSNSRVFSPRVVTLENTPFNVSIMGNPAGNEPKGSSIVVNGVLKPVNNNQMKISLKLSTW